MLISHMCGTVLSQKESDASEVKFVRFTLNWSKCIVLGDLVIEAEESKIVDEAANLDDLLVE